MRSSRDAGPVRGCLAPRVCDDTRGRGRRWRRRWRRKISVRSVAAVGAFSSLGQAHATGGLASLTPSRPNPTLLHPDHANGNLADAIADVASSQRVLLLPFRVRPSPKRRGPALPLPSLTPLPRRARLPHTSPPPTPTPPPPSPLFAAPVYLPPPSTPRRLSISSALVVLHPVPKQRPSSPPLIRHPPPDAACS